MKCADSSLFTDTETSPLTRCDYHSPAIFADNVRFWRRNRHLSIKEAADRLGVAHSTWSQWERGKR